MIILSIVFVEQILLLVQNNSITDSLRDSIGSLTDSLSSSIGSLCSTNQIVFMIVSVVQILLIVLPV